MKSKLINFIAAMGIPVSGITTQGAGCTGICGSCSLNCAPGIVLYCFWQARQFTNVIMAGWCSMDKQLLKRYWPLC